MLIIKSSFNIETQIDGQSILNHLERAGRTAYKSEIKATDNSASAFIKRIIESGHESVIEHFTITVRFICDRGVTHELVRHRLASYTQESTRYCNYAKGKFGNQITVIKPCFWNLDLANDRKKYKEWKVAVQAAEKSYLKLIELGAMPQEARSVLPNSLKTEIVVTANMREWRHILTLRCSKKAHPQIREIMLPLLGAFHKIIPILFEDIYTKHQVEIARLKS